MLSTRRFVSTPPGPDVPEHDDVGVTRGRGGGIARLMDRRARMAEQGIVHRRIAGNCRARPCRSWLAVQLVQVV
jgi:hypothetical protein